MSFNRIWHKIVQRISAVLPNAHKHNKSKSDNECDIYEFSDKHRDYENDLFLHSLKTLTPDDLAPKPPKKKHTAGDIIYEVIRRAIVVVCVCVFVGSAATLVRSFVDYQRGDELYGDIAANIFDTDLGGGSHMVSLAQPSRQNSSTPDYYTGLTLDMSELPEEDTDVTYNVEFEQMKANLNYLKEINPDIFGYIHIEGTNISFPIVQGDDNDYYLDHAYNGDALVVGSIFADYRAKADMSKNRNTVLYGHNMRDGSMFNNVTLFFDEDTFNTKLIEIYTFDGIYTYEPFAIFETISTYQYFRMSFKNDADFVAFCEEMQEQSEFNKGMTFDGDDHIITLSTCTNMTTVGRYALHAKLIKVEN